MGLRYKTIHENKKYNFMYSLLFFQKFRNGKSTVVPMKVIIKMTFFSVLLRTKRLQKRYHYDYYLCGPQSLSISKKLNIFEDNITLLIFFAISCNLFREVIHVKDGS